MPTKGSRTALFGIVATIFVSSTGIGSLFPVLPLYLRDRGASYALVGVIVGAALVAQAIGQWPAGILAERVGRREMMVAGLVVAAAASLAFVLPLSVPWLIAVRFIQGLGFAAVIPAEFAAVADVVPPDQLGRAYGWVAGAQQGGFIAGPAIGGLLTVFGRSAVFVVTGVALLAAAGIVIITLKNASAAKVTSTTLSIAPLLLGRSRVGAAVRAVLILSVGLGFLIGIYDVVWSLFMRTLTSSDPLIGLSFTLFALPLLVATPLAGWMADRWDRRWLAFWSIVLGSLIGPIYPFLKEIPVIFVIGAFEGSLWAFTGPSMNSFLMDAVTDRRAEAQGIVGTAMSAAIALGSLTGGSLFAVGVGVPFIAAAVAGVVFALIAVPGLRTAGSVAPQPVT